MRRRVIYPCKHVTDQCKANDKKALTLREKEFFKNKFCHLDSDQAILTSDSQSETFNDEIEDDAKSSDENDLEYFSLSFDKNVNITDKILDNNNNSSFYFENNSEYPNIFDYIIIKASENKQLDISTMLKNNISEIENEKSSSLMALHENYVKRALMSNLKLSEKFCHLFPTSSLSFKHDYTPNLKLIGFKNKKNFCYLNSTIQFLSSIGFFFDICFSKNCFCEELATDEIFRVAWHTLKYILSYFISNRDSSTDDKIVSREIKLEDSSKVQKHVTIFDIFSSYYKIKPYYVKNFLNLWLSDRNIGDQQDASEFLLFFLEKLSDECRWTNDLETKSIVEGEFTKILTKKKLSKLKMYGFTDDSIIKRAFGGTIRTAYFDLNGRKRTEVIEPFTLLSLCPNESVKSIEDALKNYCSIRKIEDDSKTSFYQTKFEDLPLYLIITLNKFIYDRKTSSFTKLDHEVKFSEVLTIDPEWCSSTSGEFLKNYKYDLLSVIYRDGENTDSGHFYCAVKKLFSEQTSRHQNSNYVASKMNDNADSIYSKRKKGIIKHEKDKNKLSNTNHRTYKDLIQNFFCWFIYDDDYVYSKPFSEVAKMYGAYMFLYVNRHIELSIDPTLSRLRCKSIIEVSP